MKRIALGITGLAAIVFVSGSMEAQFKGEGKYQASIVENNTGGVNPTCASGGTDCDAAGFSFTKEKSKIKIKPSGKDFDGGLTTQLKLKFIHCPGSGGNDKDKPGKCGVKGNPVTNHVMDISVTAAGLDLENVAGLLFDIEKGKSTFVSSGKNKIGGSAVGGALITALFQQPFGIGRIKIRTPGSDVTHPTTGCDVVPLPPGNTCTDGTVWAFAGIRVGEDSQLECLNSSQCSLGQICDAGQCVAEQCTIDADCDQDGGGSGGTGECGADGECCDPLLEPGCESEV